MVVNNHNKNKDYMLRVRMDFKTLKKLDEICEQRKVKRSEMTRILIEKEYNNLKR